MKAGLGEVRFTQFLRPDGRERPAVIDRSEAVAAKAAALAAAGYRLEIEELRDGTVSMTVEHPRGQDDDGPLSIRLCPNGPAVPGTVDALVNEAHSRFTALNTTTAEEATHGATDHGHD